MDRTVIKEKLDEAGLYYLTDERMRKHTSFNIGGPADFYVVPKTVEQISACRQICESEAVPFTVIGNGSNVVFSDLGYRGVVMSTASLTDEPQLVSAVDVRCAAGVKLATLCSFALENSLSGVECLWGIPGSVGGAVYMNAGAYGGEVKDTLISCTCMKADGEIVTYSADELDLSYRHSRLADSDEILLDATFRLVPAAQAEIREKMDDLMNRRRSKQPLDYPSAGSVVKRPQGYYAAALIEECGLKGCSVGGAQVSQKHSGFIINTGDATCFDLKRLIEKVKQEVFMTHGVTLECEIKIIGE